MTTNERRIAAYMRFHGYTRKEAEAAVRAKPNPTNAPKAAKKRLSKKRYINRPSQAGEQRAPSARLKARRKANLSAPKGVFPNPLEFDYVLQFKDGSFYTGKAGPAFASYSKRDAFTYTESGAHKKAELVWAKSHGAKVVRIDDAKQVKKNPLKQRIYTVVDVKQLIVDSLFKPVNGRTLTKEQAANIIMEKASKDGNKVSPAVAAMVGYKNPLKPGITARPRKGASSVTRSMLSVDHAKSESGPWTIAGIFPNRQLAADYAKAMANLNPRLWWRVATL